MNNREVSMLLIDMVKQKINQGYAVRVGQVDYNLLVLKELNKIEHFSDKYSAELNCLSKCIRKYIWKENTKQLYPLICRLNIVSEIFSDIITADSYWNFDTIIYYVSYLYEHRYELKVSDETVYSKIIDLIQTAGSKDLISKQWKDILSAEDGNKAFIDMFDDLFENAIGKYESDFIHSLEDSAVLYRMVKESVCDENRFVPWPNKVQNRWNPPGKTYLYLSYAKTDMDFNKDLTLGQYICLLECKLECEMDTCFCRFKPVTKGRILDLSYNDVELYEFRRELEKQVEIQSSSLLKVLLEDETLLKRRNDKSYVKDKISSVVASNPIDKSIIEKNSARQVLKLICSCIYKKVNEKDEDALKVTYKSFQILAEYLEKKGITGIIYPCTRTNKVKGKNLVLFNIHDAEPVKGSIKRYHFKGNV